MKNKIKTVVYAIIGFAAVITLVFLIVNYLNDKNKLTVDEKKWINNNLSTVQNINVVNDINIFASSGYGVYFDFINDLAKEYSLKINPITNNISENVNDGFTLTNNINNNSIVFYEDHYVLVSQKYQHIKDINDLKNLKIGILTTDEGYIKNYLPNLEFIGYESYNALEEAFKNQNDINYMLVPRIKYLGYTISNNYTFIYHLSDVKTYFTYQAKENDPLSSIISKYFNNWKKNNLDKSLNDNLLSTFTSNLNLTEKDIKNLTSKVYNYGFVNNSPYEVLMGGTYGGIVSEYLKKFSDFTGVEFKFTRYRNYNTFNNAINNGNIDLYFNYYRTTNSYQALETGMNINYYVIAKNGNNIIVNSPSSLKNSTVYVLEDSILYEYLTNIDGISIRTYKSIKELKSLAKNNCIIIIDKETYDYMANSELKNYTIRYSSSTNNTYNFKLNTDEAFTKLFSKYVMSEDPEAIRIEGLYNHSNTIHSGAILSAIAKYILYIIIAISIIIFLLYKKSRKIKISKKIKREDKIKYIDQLTSLKNRNYLNENIASWNKNTIYPQTTIIIDLNKLAFINDNYGYDNGDKQIQAASNILIRTQLDNSDIIRTDGNEFLVYLIGYDEKYIVSYIRKLYKEFKNLPYNYGATIGYSMINDDLKTIEDAINESVEDMKSKKTN